jgi:hypothetical protein
MAGAPLSSTACSRPHRLGRQGVGREDGPVEHDHVVSEAGQQQRRGGPGGARAHDDDVMAVSGHGDADSRSLIGCADEFRRGGEP